MAAIKKSQSRKNFPFFPYRQARSALVDGIESALELTRDHSLFSRYSLAILSCALVILLKIGLQPLLGDGAPFLLVLLAVLISTWFGGIGPGLVATFLTGAMIWYFFFPPGYTFAVLHPQQVAAAVAIYIVEALSVIFIVYKARRAYEMMQERTAQQAVIAVIGQYGIEENDLNSFMERVIRAISKTLHVEYAKVLELLPDGKNLRLRVGLGWKRGLVGSTLIDAGLDSQAGYTLLDSKPVIVTNLPKERRFTGTQLLHDHGVVSGISVVIPGNPKPYGILSVHTREKRIFTKNDVNFMQSLSHVLATTIERRQAKRELQLMEAISAVLVSYLDPKKALSGLVRVVVPEFADICEVYVKGDDNKVQQVDAYAVDKQKRQALFELARKYPPAKDSKRFSAIALRTGRALFFPFVDSKIEKRSTNDEEHLKLQSKLKIKSAIIVPLKIRSQIIGVITFGTTEKGNVYTKYDFAIAKEIADRVALSLDNARLYQEAREAVQARDEFLSIASHELKTPLTSMLLQLQSVLRSMKSQSLASFSIEKTMNMLESTVGQSKRLSTLINDLLNISLITTGRMTLEKEVCDLVELTQGVISRLKNQAEVSKTQLIYQGDKKIVGVWDRIRLEQVVTNLLTNAIKYGNHKPVTIKVVSERNKARLTVEDQGIGIHEDQQQVIFNRFVRAGGVGKSYKGLGVGLYLASQIIKAHQGTISVESKPKKGSTFTVELPLRK